MPPQGQGAGVHANLRPEPRQGLRASPPAGAALILGRARRAAAGRAPRRGPAIEFLCAPEDEGVIAAPFAGRPHLPDWFRRLVPVDRDRLGATDNGLTVKRCMPFFDAMTTGWIIPLAATVRLEIGEEGRRLDAGWEFDRTMVSNHSRTRWPATRMSHVPRPSSTTTGRCAPRPAGAASSCRPSTATLGR